MVFAENCSGPHPLMLYPVIKGFMKYANYRDLCSMRQVCELWKSETHSYLNKKTKIIIDGRKTLKRLLKEFRYLQELPCTTYDLTNLNSGSLKIFCSRSPSVQHLSLQNCTFNSSELRILIFKCFPTLVSLKLKLKIKNPGASVLGGPDENFNIHQPNNSRILPMSIGSFQGSLQNLRELELTGDFSKKTDIIFDIMKNAQNLEKIVSKKNLSTEDDLFGTWFAQICLGFGYQKLKCLELQSPLIESQVNLLMCNVFPVRRLSLNFAPVPFEKLICTLEQFKYLECVEVGLENFRDDYVDDLLKRFKHSLFWIAIHSNFDTKLIFPAHSYVISENRV